jgi:hypothetical protein
MSNEQDTIRAALAKLDPKNDEHWTEQGAPLLDALGLGKKLTRQEVTAAAPLFNRTNPVFVEAPAAEGTPPVETEVFGEVDASDEDQIRELSDACIAAHEVVEAAQRSVTQATNAMHSAQRKHDELLEKLEAARPKHSNILGIQAVLAAQTAEREARHSIATQARQIGLTAALLDGRSKLDSAMGRQNKQGTQRPNLTARA